MTTTTTTTPALRCEATKHGGGYYVRTCGLPAKFAATKYSKLIGICGTHANSERRWHGKVLELTTDVIATISERIAVEKADDDKRRAEKRREADKQHKARVKQEWVEYDLPWTSTLVLDTGWRDNEVRKLDIIVHPASEDAERSWDGFHVEVEMDDDGAPATLRVRNANTITPAAANELTQAVAQAALWLLELNGR